MGGGRALHNVTTTETNTFPLYCVFYASVCVCVCVYVCVFVCVSLRGESRDSRYDDGDRDYVWPQPASRAARSTFGIHSR